MALSVRHWCWRLGLASFLALIEVCVFSKDYARSQISPDETLTTETSILTPNVSVGNLPADQIDGGARRGTNLFHSFREFNVADGQRVFFSNPPGIENILSRVTGTDPSHILGILGVNGVANLFLLNPNGIIFGSNAKLDLRGSFLGSTARSIKFTDGIEFSTTNPSAPPLLTLNVPIGLQYGQDAGKILVQGKGNELSFDETGEVLEVIKTGGLAVEQGQTLALAGGEVVLEGGSLSAESGQVELWSVQGESLLTLTPTNPGWVLSDEGIQSFQDIRLSQASAIDTSGSRGGKINIQGRRVVLHDGSFIVSLTQDKEIGETVTIGASESIEASRTSPSGQPSGLLTETTGAGTAGNVVINTGKLFLRDGAQVSSSTFSQGNGGKVTVNASQLVEAKGIAQSGNLSSGLFAISFSTGKGGTVEVNTGKLVVREGAQISAATFNLGEGGDVLVNTTETVEAQGVTQTGIPSGLFAGTLGTGEGGSVEVKTKRLILQDGAQISSTTFGQGQAGNVLINASESVEARGIAQLSDSIRTSGLFATSRISNGKGGTVSVITGRLIVENGAQISATTFADGDGGNINIRASEIQLTGTADNGNPSIVFATTRGEGDGGEITIDTARLIVQEGAQLGAGTFSSGQGGNVFINATDSVELVGTVPQVPDGQFFRDQSGQQFPSGLFTSSQDIGIAGKLRIETQKLTLRNGAEIGVSNQGGGDAGNLEVTTRNLSLENQAVLSATTTSGQGGNIILQIDELLLLRRNSQISTTAGIDGAGGDGGNITIDAPDGFIVATPNQNNDIVANAFQGQGGNININARSIFNLEQRPSLPPNNTNDIDASSQFGLTGTVTIDTPDIDPSRGLVELPENFTNASQQIVSSCNPGSSARRSSFTVIGRGGIARSPLEPFQSEVSTGRWITLDAVDADQNSNVINESLPSPPPKIVEAQGWIIDENGNVSLVAQVPNTTPHGLSISSSTCS
ncbi:filamentous hemagglutinin N-terminal domain-containing protein [Nostoc sp. CCY0012]|uniref:two-partner secretion domain-containing protein n=1 Tax=Nostoc sp. CCY0012 TaxID=1056123 RepID=UPI0039C711E2